MTHFKITGQKAGTNSHPFAFAAISILLVSCLPAPKTLPTLATLPPPMKTPEVPHILVPARTEASVKLAKVEVRALEPLEKIAIPTGEVAFSWEKPASTQVKFILQKENGKIIYSRKTTGTRRTKHLQPGRYLWSIRAADIPLEAAEWISFQVSPAPTETPPHFAPRLAAPIPPAPVPAPQVLAPVRLPANAPEPEFLTSPIPIAQETPIALPTPVPTPNTSPDPAPESFPAPLPFVLETPITKPTPVPAPNTSPSPPEPEAESSWPEVRFEVGYVGGGSGSYKQSLGTSTLSNPSISISSGYLLRSAFNLGGRWALAVQLERMVGHIPDTAIGVTDKNFELTSKGISALYNLLTPATNARKILYVSFGIEQNQVFRFTYDNTGATTTIVNRPVGLDQFRLALGIERRSDWHLITRAEISYAKTFNATPQATNQTIEVTDGLNLGADASVALKFQSYLLIGAETRYRLNKLNINSNELGTEQSGTFSMSNMTGRIFIGTEF